MPFCKYCGSAHDADAVFCTECGKPISKKAAPPTKSIVEFPLEEAPEKIIRGEARERQFLPSDSITPEVEKRMQTHRDKVAQYTVSLAVFKQLFREHPDLFGEEEWRFVEGTLAEKYRLSDISIFRQKELPDFAAEQKASPPPSRRNATYTKRNAAYWSQFDTDDDWLTYEDK